ncbi:Uncharacterised protein [Mycobacteroides abscessus subsp. massiliense]|nr:Uncharacterised protein [Mycobacteroides abscessus subsp. massiliense]
MIGVMPLPAATNTGTVTVSRMVNAPAGRSDSSVIPARALSHSQFEAWPPDVRLTVTFRCSSMPGALESE